MSKHTHFGDAVIGMLTSITIGGWLFQALSVFILAIIGALAGWLFSEYLKPILKPFFDKIFKKLSNKA